MANLAARFGRLRFLIYARGNVTRRYGFFGTGSATVASARSQVEVGDENKNFCLPRLPPQKGVLLLSPAGSRLNYALKGSLTVINEEFYTVDRTPTSIGLLLNEYNYNLPSLLSVSLLATLAGGARVKNPARIPIERSIFRSSGEAPVRTLRN